MASPGITTTPDLDLNGGSIVATSNSAIVANKALPITSFPLVEIYNCVTQSLGINWVAGSLGTMGYCSGTMAAFPPGLTSGQSAGAAISNTSHTPSLTGSTTPTCNNGALSDAAASCNCPAGNVNWIQTTNTCTGSVAQLNAGASTPANSVANTASGYTGFATATCSGTGFTAVGTCTANTCTGGGTASWASCSGPIPAGTVANGAQPVPPTVTNTAVGYSGSVTLTCNASAAQIGSAGTFTQSGASCNAAANCPIGTNVTWSQSSNNCSGPSTVAIANGSTGGPTTNTAGGYTGTLTLAQCNNGVLTAFSGQTCSVTPAGYGHMYVANYNSNTVSVINTATNTVTATVAVGTHPEAIAVSGGYAYVTNSGSSNVSVINLSTNTVTATIPVDSGSGPYGVAVSGGYAYVVNVGSNTVSVINTSTNTVTTTITIPNQGTTGSFPIGISGSYAYVVSYITREVSAINTSTNTLSATISTLRQRWGRAWLHSVLRRLCICGGLWGVAMLRLRLCHQYVHQYSCCNRLDRRLFSKHCNLWRLCLCNQ